MAGRRVNLEDVTARPRALPSGQITFLLTDVVGSTRLWESVPHLMPDALARHELMIRTAVERNGGVLLKSKGEGDSTFNVFGHAGDGVRAALDAQRALRDEPWARECTITVRMALHTGEAVERDGDYFGRTVNRVARLRAIAKGGEVLVTLATVRLVGPDVPTGARLVELGLEQLRDLDHPEIVHLLTDQPGEVRRGKDEHPLRTLPLPARVRSAQHQQPIAGRKEELHRLEHAWARTTEGHPAFVVVQGEAGIGKTRLTSEFATSIKVRGGIVLAGRCDDLSGAPYQPFAEAYRFVAERIPADELASMSPSHVDALARLTPDLVDSPPTMTTAEVSREREHLLYAMNTWFVALSAEAPVLFVLEDLHWATETTLDMLRNLVLDPSAGRVMVVATMRPASSAGGPLQRLLADAHQSSFAFEQLDLRGLSSGELYDLLEGAERAVGPDAAAEVHALTNGNPLFALAVAVSMEDGESAGGVHQPLPDTVHAVLDRQLGQLGEAELGFFRSAAVLGTTFEVDLAAELADVSSDVVDEALDAGERFRIVREQSAGVLHLYEFDHALVASALVEQLTAIRRRRLHAGAARLVSTARLVDGDRVSRVAHHAAEAGNALLPLESITAFREAASHARDRMALPEAIHWLGLARPLLAAVDDTRLGLRIDIEYGAAAFAAGSPGADAMLTEIAERCLRLGDPELLADALIASDTGGGSNYLRVNATRVRLIGSALDMLPDDADAHRARLLVMLANELLYARDEHERRLELADDALVIARRLGDPSVLDAVFDHRLGLLAGPPNVEKRLAETGELLELLEQGRVPEYRRFSFLGSRSQVLQQLGRVEEGRQCLAEMRDMADADALLPRQRLFFEMIQAGWELLGGRLGAAEASVRAAFRLVKSIGVDAMGAATARQMLGVRFWQDRIDTLLEAVAFGVTINPVLRAHHAYWLLQDGRVDESAQVWADWDDDSIEALLAVGGTGESAVLEAAAVCAAFDGVDRCAFYYSLLEPYGDRIVNPYAPDQPTHHYLGLLANARREAELAESHFVASIDFAHGIDAPLMAARSSLELARLLVDWDRDDERAVALARDAGRVGRERDAAWLTRNSGDLLGSIGAV